MIASVNFAKTDATSKPLKGIFEEGIVSTETHTSIKIAFRVMLYASSLSIILQIIQGHREASRAILRR